MRVRPTCSTRVIIQNMENTIEVEFIFICQANYHISGKSHDFFSEKRMVKNDDSMREHANDLIKKALKNNIEGWLSNPNEVKNLPLSFSLLDSNIKITDELVNGDLSWIWKNGVNYDLDGNGAVIMFSDNSIFAHDWKYKNIVEVSKSGFVSGDPKRVIVYLVDGLGGGGVIVPPEIILLLTQLQGQLMQKVTDYLLTIAIEKSLSFVGMGAINLIKTFRNSKIRKIAQQWSKNGLKYPYQLREFLELNAEWKLKEIKTRLKLNDQYAIRLLHLLGYEPISNSWSLTQSNYSIKARKNWMKSEKKYQRITELQNERNSK